MKFRLVGDHPEDLHDGRQVAPGDYVDLRKEDLREDLIEDLIAEGKLIGVDKKAEEEIELAERRVKTRALSAEMAAAATDVNETEGGDQ